MMIALSAARLPASRLIIAARRLFLLIELSFAMVFSLLDKRHVETSEQRLRFGVGLGGGANDDVHTADLVDFVVVDFREHKLFLQAHGVIAAAVEALRVHAAEVAYAGK